MKPDNQLNGSGDLNPVEIYPNPSSDFIQLNINEAWKEHEISQTTLIDVTGKVWLKFSGLQSSIDVSNLPPGAYFIEVILSNQKFQNKFIKI